MNDPTDSGIVDSAADSPLNDMALASFLTGLGGWLLLVMIICSAGSSFAICCFGVAFLSWVVAIFTGNFALREISGQGEGGRKLALWGMYSGATGLLLGLIVATLLVASALGLLSISILDQMTQTP